MPDRTNAWDSGCGNGQVAGVLADHFDNVEATDISEQQLELAIRKPNIHYQLAPAEKTNLKAESISLMTVAQAIHWFDLDKFYREVMRVGKSGSILAVWCYSLLTVNKEINEIIQRLYTETLGDKYWDPERKLIDEHYQTIPFPFEEIEAPAFKIKTIWSLGHLIGYLNSWSAVQKYIRENSDNPVSQITSALKDSWGEEEELEIEFPLFLRIGRIEPLS